MKIVIVYVHAPHVGGDNEYLYALRFMQSYHTFKTEVDHSFVVAINSGSQYAASTNGIQVLFASLKNVNIIQHDNSGYDIGAFQMVSRTVPADLMLFFGASSYIRGDKWLERVVESVNRRGDTLYGTMVNSGMANFGVYPHIRTTGFWISPKLFNQYPLKVERADQRYEFEHRSNCLCEWIKARKLLSWLVTWDGEYPNGTWRNNVQGFHQGNQENLIFGDRLSEPPFFHCP